MCRPRSSFIGQMILGALAALVVGGCGKGLYTNGAQVRVPDGSVGGATMPETGTGSGAGGTGGGTTSSDSRGSTGGTSGTSPDVKPDAGSGDSVTKSGNYYTQIEISNGEANLLIPKGALPQGGPYRITLSLESSDGTMPNYDGAVGPIYSIAVEEGGEGWNDSAVLRIHVPPSDLGISSQRLGVAYLDEKSNGWIAILSGDTYDPETREVIGKVGWFKGKRFFAPFETCPKPGQDGGACRARLRCLGEACQQ